MHNQINKIDIRKLRLCYSAMNYTDELGVVHTVIQIYTYKYSPIFVENELSIQQEEFIANLGLIKIRNNLYTTDRSCNIAQFNNWAKDNGLIFSNTVYCFLDEHLYDFGGIYFEKYHRPRKDPRNNTNQYDNKKDKEKTYANERYNPRKRYTGSEDETARLWYDFD